MQLYALLPLCCFVASGACAEIELPLGVDVPPLLESVLQILPLPTEPATTAPTSATTTTRPACQPPTTSTAPAPTRWTMSPHMTDLSSWNVTNFACGRQNLQFVHSIPSSLSAPAPSPSANTPILLSPARPLSLLRITYPSHSSDPSLTPLGGSDFYATPLPLSHSTSASLSYSIFFPQNFDFVRGGKLPGLYGGAYECSAGRSAEWCWSSRLMWRSGGKGELYLYAPLAAQTAALCTTPPQTICGSADGQSIGRGSFNFTRGGWTQVRQTVRLNTPGMWDGGFDLWAGGVRVIGLEGVFWRNEVPGAGQDGDDGEDDGDADEGGEDGIGLLDLPGLLLEMPTSPYQHFLLRPSSFLAGNTTRARLKKRSTIPQEPVGFSGIFFSTFFGGSGPEWETPVETWTWFRDFELVVNY
ncbi:polysaccharide lyase family 14 protein [Calocera viscosa TUFC12733]|uniref:Polysaccharide lyase family 14 protein n=1 Tax=Calocera viscosa (strain TUFC12733) TaxID=1330018 RepID=A0A167I848_CALVF|nr:polysaccharide lyase family 14 protein [Calocera viscosa TUFC12733]